ncbi:MAG: glycosyltransferase [Candidatus Latescibacteria bacterium]|nr:glycosyltransferase [Candidatus Latescibacterota bacterium]
MRVCVLTTGFPRFAGDLFGGFVLDLCRRLVAQGVEVEVLAPHQHGLPRREELAGVPIRRFSYMVPSSWQRVAYGGGIPTNLRNSWVARLEVPFFLAGFWWRARGSSRGAALIHCHWTICGLVGYLAVRRRCPVVLSVRGSDINLLAGGWMGRLNRWIYRRMDMVIGVSKDIAARLQEAGVPSAKVRVVYNGVDPRFCPGDQAPAREGVGLPPERFVVLFVGMLVPVKGLEVLLQALARLDEPQVCCAIVGGGPQEAGLRELAARLGLLPRVVFAGPRSTDEVPRWMQAADLLVLPSLSEGRPNVVLEAQACGLPVVATRVGGTPELVEDGINGVLVDSGDPQQLAQAIAGLQQYPAGRGRVG